MIYVNLYREECLRPQLNIYWLNSPDGQAIRFTLTLRIAFGLAGRRDWPAQFGARFAWL